MKNLFRPLLVIFAVLTAFTGLAYPAVMTAFGQAADGTGEIVFPLLPAPPACVLAVRLHLMLLASAGTVSGVASEVFCPSLPFTPYEITVPIRMPRESVAKIVSV